ncbi:MAG: NAD(+) synthase [Lachnospiraceae bacterium]
MKDNFIRAAAVTPKIKVADVAYNKERILECIEAAYEKGAKLIVLPELALTGYTCNDLFLQSSMIDGALQKLRELLEDTKEMDAMIVVGLPMEHQHRLYNVAAFMKGGSLMGLVTKQNIPNYSEFYEKRYFAEGRAETELIAFKTLSGDVNYVSFGGNILFQCRQMPDLVIGAEICEDVWVPNPPSISHALHGATVIVNSSASDETTGKAAYRESLIGGQSARLVCGYVYCNAGEGESTQDLVFGGHNIIAENGTLLAESGILGHEMILADLDLDRIRSERRRMGTFMPKDAIQYDVVDFDLNLIDLDLKRFVDPAPFVPSDAINRTKRCEEILSIQSMGLKKRLEHTGVKTAVVGISGGLDSTLALLVITRAFDMLGLPRSGIISVTMPCFGTTDRTYQNACQLTRLLGATLIEINIKEAVNLHFRDIGHDPQIKNLTYENSQARERTQILMDVAGKNGGLVVGTGDMSELALGWATYNGDHMSMYGVNASVPKTLVRHLVRYYADICKNEQLTAILLDILDTPVSPELLPPEENGEIAQKTEDIVGPYELHDFFLYYVLRFGYHPAKIYRMAVHAFAGIYDKATIYKWLTKFYWRYFSQQFKRSCLPDGPKVGSVAVSPRGDLRMPSDASVRLWIDELEQIRVED